MDNGDAEVGSEEDSFFEMLSRFQGRRIDDQRCCSSVLDSGALREIPAEDEDKENICTQGIAFSDVDEVVHATIIQCLGHF